MPSESFANDLETLALGARLEVFSHVWAIREDALSALSDLQGRVVSHELTEAASQKGRPTVPAGGVAVIPLKGMITPRPSLLSLLFGGGDGSLSSFTGNLRAAVANPDVHSIVMDVDSPGGMVDGVPEAAAIIRSAATVKPIVAVANTQIGSAAYWLAAQAHELAVTPSGEVGSIGAYQIHRDMSAALDKAGIKPTVIKAGRYKAEGMPFEPLSDDARDHAQEVVDDHYQAFVNDVAKGRGVTADEVQAGYGEGRMLTAKRAVSAGLADRVATLEATTGRLGSGRARVRRTDAGAYVIDCEDDLGRELETKNGSSVAYTEDEKGRLLATLAGLR